MLTRTTPFPDLDRLFFGAANRPSAVPMDAYRDGGEFVVQFDLPGVGADSITVDVERNVLTVRAERPVPEGIEYRISERPHGTFSRRLVLGDALDTDRVEAGYDAGVLTVRIPVADRAKSRRITVGTGAAKAEIDA